MIHSSYPIWASRLSDLNLISYSLHKVLLLFALTLYPSLSHSSPSSSLTTPFPVTTKHLFKAFRALSKGPRWLSYLSFTTHLLCRDRGWERKESHWTTKTLESKHHGQKTGGCGSKRRIGLHQKELLVSFFHKSHFNSTYWTSETTAEKGQRGEAINTVRGNKELIYLKHSFH